MRNGKAQAGEIRFEHVWFAYKDDDYVIKDLNFTIHPGEKVALVGPTGAGKVPSSASVPPLRTQRGRILVDGIDVRNLPQSELRCLMGSLQEGSICRGCEEQYYTGRHLLLDETGGSPEDKCSSVY